MRSISLILAFFLLTVNIYSQNRTITGTIVDQNGAPIPNATVLVKGTKQGVASNDKGEFAISIKRKVYFISVILCLNYFILNKG